MTPDRPINLQSTLPLWQRTVDLQNQHLFPLASARLLKEITQYGTPLLPDLRDHLNAREFSFIARELATQDHGPLLLDRMLTPEVLQSDDIQMVENYQIALDKSIFYLRFLNRDRSTLDTMVRTHNRYRRNHFVHPDSLGSELLKKSLALTASLGIRNWIPSDDDETWKRWEGFYLPPDISLDVFPDNQADTLLHVLLKEPSADATDKRKLIRATKAFRVMFPKTVERNYFDTDCGVISPWFKSFCKENLGLEVNTACWRIGEGEPGGYDCSDYHEVVVAFGSTKPHYWKPFYADQKFIEGTGIILDFSPFQFPELRNEAYPYVCRVGEHKRYRNIPLKLIS